LEASARTPRRRCGGATAARFFASRCGIANLCIQTSFLQHRRSVLVQATSSHSARIIKPVFGNLDQIDKGYEVGRGLLGSTHWCVSRGSRRVLLNFAPFSRLVDSQVAGTSARRSAGRSLTVDRQPGLKSVLLLVAAAERLFAS